MSSARRQRASVAAESVEESVLEPGLLVGWAVLAPVKLISILASKRCSGMFRPARSMEERYWSLSEHLEGMERMAP